MIADPELSANSVGLRHVSDTEPGIRRVRAGRGFRYIGPDDQPVTDQRTLERIAALVIPPAWTDVWISRVANGHLQATGRDARGRKQYRYHASWTSVRGETKFATLAAFARTLPALREHVAADLRRHGLPREKVLAAVVTLLETTYARIGNESYARDNDSFGLTTLRNRHVRVDGNALRFRFTGKSGKDHRFSIDDPRMARILRRCRDLPGQLLFQYESDGGTVSRIDSADVNDYLREITGTGITAKDFRTWAGTCIAAETLAPLDVPESEAAANRHIVDAVDAVAVALGNTRAVSRSAYIHPAILDAYRTGELQEMATRSRRWKAGDAFALGRIELLVLRLIEAQQTSPA